MKATKMKTGQNKTARVKPRGRNAVYIPAPLVTIDLGRDLKKRLDACIDERDEFRSVFIRRAIERELKRVSK